ncbi:MAG: hypothetical protein LBQ98_02585 [Nitrososphaerota archaeon]|jgi:hypothetical protein|nr:hypothetical protein [Nitrososphaerota archaeon]
MNVNDDAKLERGADNQQFDGKQDSILADRPDFWHHDTIQMGGAFSCLRRPNYADPPSEDAMTALHRYSPCAKAAIAKLSEMGYVTPEFNNVPSKDVFDIFAFGSDDTTADDIAMLVIANSSRLIIPAGSLVGFFRKDKDDAAHVMVLDGCYLYGRNNGQIVDVFNRVGEKVGFEEEWFKFKIESFNSVIFNEHYGAIHYITLPTRR